MRRFLSARSRPEPAEYASRGAASWEQVVRRDQLASVTACSRAINRAHRRARPCSRTSRSTTRPTSRGCAPLEANWKTIRAELDDVLAYHADAAELPGHLHRPVPAHRRRPLEDVLLLRLRLPQRRQLRALPRDHAARSRPSPAWRRRCSRSSRPASASRRTTARTRACCATTSGCSCPRPGGAARHPGRRPRSRSWREGKSLVFDDTYEHEAWNETDATRVVLFLDVVRPLRQPMQRVQRGR